MKLISTSFRFWIVFVFHLLMFNFSLQAGVPSVTVSPPSGPTNSSSLIFNVTFSEDVTGFDTPGTDLTITNTTGGVLSGTIAMISASTYNITITGMTGPAGNVSLTIPAGAATSTSTTSPNTISNTGTVAWDGVAPTVTINQGGSQADPGNGNIVFTAVFSEAITGFTNADITIGGTAGATTAAVSTSDNVTWTVTISGMTSNGTVTASIPANAAQDAAGNNSTASTSTDNSVTYDGTVPSVTINQGGSQNDPTSGSSIVFTAVFSEAILNFTDADITISGTAGATTAAVSTANNITWTVTITGMTTTGTVTASIPANAAQDAAGNNSTASTSTDNSVTYDVTAPTVTINQGGSQSDPTKNSPIIFTAVFSEAVTGFTNADITIGGSSGATTAAVSSGDGGITWTVNITGMSTTGPLTVTIPANAAQDAAGNNSGASTSTDNSVTYDITNPTASGAFSPADGATGVSTAANLIITFSEAIQFSTTGSVTGSQDKFQVKKSSDNSVIIDLTRGASDIIISGNQVTVTNNNLDLSTDYYVNIGSKVFSDLAGNDYGGISSTTTWNFTTGSSGATVNNLTSSACTNKYATISNIVITESDDNNIQGAAGTSKTIILGFGSNGFVFNPSTTGVSATAAAGQDITSIAVTSVTYTSVTLTVTFVASGNATNDPDVITISGLKVAYDGTSTTPVNIVKTGGNLTIQGITNNVTSLATLISATQSAGPSITTTDLTYCQGENIAGATVAVSGAGGSTFNWYNDAALSSFITSGNSVNITALGVSSTSVTSFTKYVTQTETSKCESNGVAVVFTIAPNPVADAGADETVANGNTEVCSDAEITLGGSPTLQTPSVSGAYTYAWTSTPVVAISNTPNPQITLTNNSGSIASYLFTVTITDANSCTGNDTKNVDVKTALTPQLTQPNSTTFSTNTAPLILAANPAGGIFSGVGVIQTGPTTYKFSAAAAYDNTQPLPQNYPITYTVTSAGCTVTNYPIATMTLSNQLFSTLVDQYCSSEYPTPTNNSSGIQLSADVNAYNNLINNVNSWNTYTRFYYAPYNSYSGWNSLVIYGTGAKVRYGNEIYISLLALNLSNQPDNSPAAWQLSTEGKVTFTGTVRNYYEGYYGGNAGGTSTIYKQTGTYTVSSNTFNYYEMLTNTNYVNCSNCDYNYPAFYMEFVNPSDMQYFMTWNSGYYYYPGDIVYFGSSFYKCILTYSSSPYYTYNQQPNLYPGIWQAVTSFDNGYYFYQGGASGVFSTGQFVTINKNPNTYFTGLVSGLVSDAEFCNVNQNYNLTGNFSSGIYKIDLGAGFVAATGANGLTSNPGGAGIFNPGTTFSFLSNPSTPRTIGISYTVDPGTIGSTSQACTGTQTQIININPLPSIALTAPSPNPDPATQLCYNGTSITLTSTPADGNVRFNGYGILDNNNGTSTLNPKNSFEVSVFQTGTPNTTNQAIAVNATYTNPANGCKNTSPDLIYTVKPLSPASFAYANRSIYCYEDLPQDLIGGQATASYDIVYAGAATPYTLNIPSKDYTFDPKAIFDDAVANHGANPNVAQNFDITYTAIVSGCSNTFSIRFTVNPKIILDIPGITDDQIFCSSTLAPSSLTVNGNITGSGSFDVSPDGTTFSVPAYINNNVAGSAVINLNQAYSSLPGTSGYKDLYVRYTQTTAGCTGSGSFTRKIRISDPPSISFSATPSDGQFFCRDATAVTLTTVTSSNQSPNTITITGPGITDIGNGTATFDPNSAMTSLEAANNTTYTYATRPTAQIVAQIKDANQCVNNVNKPLIINPTPPASVANYATNLCYTGSSITLDGQQTSAFYEIIYKDVSRTDNFGNTSTPTPDISFNPKTFFDNAVALGANPLNTLSFDVYYTSFDPDLCLNNLSPVTIQVAPQIIPTIAGIDDLEEYCSTFTNGNTPNSPSSKTITLTPSSGTLYISTNSGPDVPTPFSIANNTGVYQFSTSLAGGTFKFTYNYLSGNNCLNSANKTVYVFPTPVASFPISPRCDQDIIDYSADGSQNSAATPTYDWTFDNTQSITGQNTQYQFPGTGTYDVDLLVTYPANGATNLVCSSQLLQKQTVGQIPVVDFTVTDVCEGDNTLFSYITDIPLANLQWDFGDGVSNATAFGGPNQPVVVTNGNTTGTNGFPLHTYAASGPYSVTFTAKTAAINGACTDTETKEVNILKYLTSISPASFYSMKTLNGEDGFWVKEDINQNSTWEFNAPTKSVISSSEKAWVTNPTGFYLSDDDSYVNSPCFNLNAFTRPVISIKYWVNTPLSDGVVLQSSVNGGATWQTVGNIVNGFSSGQNWFNAVGISSGPGGQSNYGWSKNDMTNWAVGKHSLDVIPSGSRTKVRFRIAFKSIEYLTPPTYDGFAFNDVKIEERNRTILVENFTNASADNAASNTTQFQLFKNNLASNEIVKIEYHTDFPGDDNISKQNLVDPNARAAFYGVTTPPKGFIDGFSSGNFNGNWTNQYFSIRSLDPSPMQIAFILPVTPDPDILEGKVRITSSANLAAGAYVVHICAIERQVGSNDFILRKMIPSASGTNLPSMAANTTFDVDFSWVPDPAMINNIDNLEIVAFVQQLQGSKEVLQTTLLNSLPPLNFVVTGIESTIDASIKVYPVPSDDIMNILLPESTNESIPVKLFDTFGKMVVESKFKPQEKLLSINTKDFSSGVYLIRLETPKGLVLKKIIVAHN